MLYAGVYVCHVCPQLVFVSQYLEAHGTLRSYPAPSTTATPPNPAAAAAAAAASAAAAPTRHQTAATAAGAP